ncbi:hypothetical protein F7D13_01650 [Methylocystis rosea]|uniref:DUF6946 domain-containing protein n=1 Tax=Methylocystis rosea TaxID=173366 RepID=A0ABX6EDT7_9HYPH|nr:hypothetical protein [Methylocystis rosea]QGM92824.1 hypothetical protein F7D13_01650 [Methylocystis rosea]
MRIYVPSKGPESWQLLLADTKKHWQPGFSAMTLAHAWESADGLPPEISRLFEGRVELLLGLPEHKVDLPGGSRPSQTDLFALLRHNDRVIATAVEGKVDETFGPTVGQWLEDASDGKRKRLEYLCGVLGLMNEGLSELRYQLLHRAASAAIESERFKTDEAAMIVHSFSQTNSWFDSYAAFAQRMGVTAEVGRLATTTLPCGRVFHLAWAAGDTHFQAA